MINEKAIRVLVADGDASIRRVVSIALRLEAFDVSVASTGREVLDRLAAEPVDVVLLDVDLPGISGIDVMRRARKTTTSKIILMTGGCAGYSYAKAIEEGASDLVLKPVRLADLSRLIRQTVATGNVV